ELSLALVEPEKDRALTGVIEVVPVSTLELLAFADGSAGQWPVQLMKKGTVKFFNESKVTHDKYLENGRFLLSLPQELQNLVDDAAKGSSHVIIILREVQEGKKGLNAVNVKLA